MPVGDLPGLTQTFAEDFNTPVASGSFASTYAAKLPTYNGFADTSGLGTHDNSMSVHDGALDESLFPTGDFREAG